MEINHYPIFARKVARECAEDPGTVNPFAEVTCPKCRARLMAKVRAEQTAAQTTLVEQERIFHTANATQWLNTIAGTHQ